VSLDGEFTQEEFLRQLRQAPRSPVVHIASHFAFSAADGGGSYLLLGDGQHLTISDITRKGQIFQGVDLLTLSACNTASGGGGDGHEFEGLGMAAQKQGAEAVLATLWPVSDESTGLLMQYFYQLRQATPGVFKAEALRQAQAELIHGDIRKTMGVKREVEALVSEAGAVVVSKPALPGYSHPFYWAPFVLIGNWK